jgi:ribonuclease PH
VARDDGRAPGALREVRITRNWLDHAEGSVLVEFGRTRVLCAASFTEGVPRWRKGSGEGWVTAEYAMLPAGHEHARRPRVGQGAASAAARTRSRGSSGARCAPSSTPARSARTPSSSDCDVLQADGGTAPPRSPAPTSRSPNAIDWARSEQAA